MRGRPLIALLLGCAGEPPRLAGQAVDARTGAPLADFVLEFRAPDCAAVQARTGPDGRWEIEGGCAWEAHPEAGWASGADGRYWRAPTSDGIYLIDGPELRWLATNTALDTERVFDSEREVRYPEELPGSPPRVSGDAVLLLAGLDLPIEPLVASDRRVFGTTEAPRPVDPWFYLGVSFAGDTALTDVPVTPACTDAPLPRALRYCPAGALPAGRYVIVAGARGLVIDFG